MGGSYPRPEALSAPTTCEPIPSGDGTLTVAVVSAPRSRAPLVSADAEIVLTREHGEALHDAAVAAMHAIRGEAGRLKGQGRLTEADDEAAEREFQRFRRLKTDLESEGCWSPLIQARHTPTAPREQAERSATVRVYEDPAWLAAAVLRGVAGSAYLVCMAIEYGVGGDWPLSELKRRVEVFGQLETLLDQLGWPDLPLARPDYPWPELARPTAAPGSTQRG